MQNQRKGHYNARKGHIASQKGVHERPSRTFSAAPPDGPKRPVVNSDYWTLTGFAAGILGFKASRNSLTLLHSALAICS